ncbi:exopolysaccharide biosynthesis polyprenyl glycosylphosphotransferase [Streptomyces avicenniae]|uniref:exopolysaccharide biosynthesis polyprenyl glycosylphosphotransferase n=1 Tax=Streptomyces avicenniae TaxID=500153 RepID=UPI00069A07B8|nr:exopolysaccharide biosynthesis polyprenyl glycosylphosphotransferase [Streptomyces avicenniae]
MTIEGTAQSPAAVIRPPRVPQAAPVAVGRGRRDRRGSASRAGRRLAVADVCAVVGTACWALPGGLPGSGARALIALVLGTALLLALNAAAALYRPLLGVGVLDECPRLFAHCVVSWCVADAVTGAALPLTALLALVVGQGVSIAVSRTVAHAAHRRSVRRRPRSALIVGTGPLGQRVAAGLVQQPAYGLRPVGLVGPVPRRLPTAAPLPVLAAPGDIVRAVIQNTVRDAVFMTSPRPDLLRLFWARGCVVWQVCTDPVTARGASGNLLGFPCHRIDPPRGHAVARPVKRALDLAVAASALALTAPLMATCALAVRLTDGPGVLFRQERVGLDGRSFVMLKFRTLRPADEREAATRWSIADDPRVSPVGRLLRRSSLDELPQLWNVLRGDMSLVGPRPERPHFVERFSRAYPGYADRHRMPAGITGLAQVSGARGAASSIEDRTRFDNFYIETWSLWQDVRIMLRTAAECCRFGGS